ncbi:4Fe-4S dicluster domain-containing protein [Thermosphaera chiliense]|uniref:4Fe-4S dicluster domain-containing protein n=1 Tax=Thermosphaera chiliense TaxID=3402707 RepID=A0A7M1UR00_9CREN|nr:flavoprotein [Thermosphaera aggregans]QOR93947.1 4Fe-4S dicluster domain-containing protein [Thermosphaera aggregans]
MPKAIAWGITGAGSFLRESVETIIEIVERGIPVTVYCSKAGESLLKSYGLIDKLAARVKGAYPTEIVYESKEPPSYPSTGRFYVDIYDLAVISPATLNTSSKIVHGISDSLVSNLASHALKNNIQLLILPVDYFETKSTIPIKILRDNCGKCFECTAAEACPTGALTNDSNWKVRLDISKCTRCFECLRNCPWNAILFDVEIMVKPNPYYVKIIEKLYEIPNVRIIEHPRKVLELLSGERP